MYKNYIGISKDHSVSMQSIARAAARDYNENITAIKESAGQDTIISVVQCGVGRPAKVVREIVNSSVVALQPIDERKYITDGNATPLFDSIGELIEILESAPDADDPNVSFLVMAITDGEENNSSKWSATTLANKIRQLQATDRWTFVFRVPRGYGAKLSRSFGIPEGNIQEWDQTERGMAVSTQATRQAVAQYYGDLKAGKKSTDKFFTNLKDVPVSQIKASLVNISSEVFVWNIATDTAIRPFCEAQLNGAMMKGCAFYQLTKTESQVQDYKQIAIRDKISGSVYSGHAARDMLGLPRFGTVKVAPGDHDKYDIFIQSTSVNRKLLAGTKLLYWPNAQVLK